MVGGYRFLEKMHFKYITELVEDEKTKQMVPTIPRLKIEVVFRKYSEAKDLATNPEFRTHGLVDSGADTSFIPRQIAEILQLELREEDKKKSKSASEEFWTYRTKVHLEIMYKGRRVVVGTVDVSVPEQPAQSSDIQKMVLLGRAGIFEQYEITFNESSKVVTFKKIHKSKVKRF
ncbi:MAG: hypothetical protein ACREBI_02975 [Nitrosotalea sp.]